MPRGGTTCNSTWTADPSATEGVCVQPAEGSDHERQARLPAPQPVEKRIARQAALAMTSYAPWGGDDAEGGAARSWRVGIHRVAVLSEAQASDGWLSASPHILPVV